MTLLRYAACVLGLAATTVWAQESHESQETPPRLDYRVELGLEHNDNVNLNEEDPKSDDILTPAFGFTYRQGGSVVQAHVDGVLTYRDYLHGTFGDDLRSQIGGHVNWTMVPDRVNFVFEDYLGIEPVDTLQVDSPANQQQTNVFGLGPTFDFRFGSAARGAVELRYVNSYAEVSDQFDSNRYVGAFRVLRDLSSTSLVSGNVEAQHIDFIHDIGGPSFDRYNLFGRYVQTLRQFEYSADLGWNWIHSGFPLGDHNAPLARFTVGYHATERSRFDLIGAYQYSDAATDLLETVQTNLSPTRVLTEIPTSIPTGAAVVSPQPYLETNFLLLYGFHEVLWTFDISAALPEARLPQLAEQPVRRIEPDPARLRLRARLQLQPADHGRRPRHRRERRLSGHRSRRPQLDDWPLFSPDADAALELERRIHVLQAQQQRGRPGRRAEHHLRVDFLHALKSRQT